MNKNMHTNQLKYAKYSKILIKYANKNYYHTRFINLNS